MSNYLLAGLGLPGGALGILVIALVVVSIALFVTLIYALVLKISVASVYVKYNNAQTEGNLTAEEAARQLLDKEGLTDVTVEKAGFFWAWFFGNSYSPRKKAIKLRGNIYGNTTLTAVSIACQKVGLAIQHENREPKYMTRAAIQPFILFAPAMIIPLILVGLVIDVVMANTGFIATIIAGLIGILYYIGAFLYTLFTIPVERKANDYALKAMEKHNFLTEDERISVKKLFGAYIKSYIADFIVEVLYIIYYILRVVIKILSKAKK